MTELSGETCETCHKDIIEGEVNYRPSATIKNVGADGAELPGNPLSLEYKRYCPACVADYDKSN